MHNKKHGHLLKLVLLMILMVVGFKDSGIFVQDFTVLAKEEVPVQFKDGEEVEVVKEGPESYHINKDGTYFEVPKNVMIRTTRKGDRFTVKELTPILTSTGKNGSVLRQIVPGEELILVQFDEKYGRFITVSDFQIGYIPLDKADRNTINSISYGVANVSTTVRNENTFMVMIKGETVGILGYSDGKYTLIDGQGELYTVDKASVTLYKSMDEVTRSADKSASKAITALLKGAYAQMGKPYVYASAGPNSFDCSGFTYYVYKNYLGITLPRSSYLQPGGGTKIEKSELRPGDLVFFNTTGSRISHVGLYIGDGNMIHASSNRGLIRIDTIESGWYFSRYVTAVRVIN
ncbi:MAG: C40 family peptidase [Gudongella sp.]|nr:C40 family peptidase [Gudongella sp.]